MTRSLPAALLAAALACACGADRALAPPGDAGSDAGFSDAGSDGGPGIGDAGGSDAGLDGGSDAGLDGGSDAGLDAGADAGPDDGGVDAGHDAGVDVGLDAGPTAAAQCPVEDMTQLYSGFLPPNPFGSGIPAAGECAVAHDAIILLGCPSNSDGSPSGSQIARADLAMALSQAGYASNFIVSGGAIHNQYVEADALAALLLAGGVDNGHIFRDVKAAHTDENIYYSDQIMQAQGWTTAIIVSDDPGQFTAEAVCDSNCCVELGRLTLLDFPTSSVTARSGHYVRYPWTQAVTSAECQQIETVTKAMCTLLSGRRACAGRLMLPP